MIKMNNRKYIFIQILFFIFLFHLNAQYDNKLVLKDGTVLIGRAWSKGKNYVMFKPSKKEKKIKYKRELVYSREDTDPKTGIKKTFFYKKIKGKKEIRSLKKHVSGRLEGYLLPVHVNIPNGGYGYFEDYCIGKSDEDSVMLLNYGPKFKKFQKVIDYYFSDCPELVSKINNLEFGEGVESIEKMINYYNQNCH